jgi:hypothetical protein
VTELPADLRGYISNHVLRAGPDFQAGIGGYPQAAICHLGATNGVIVRFAADMQGIRHLPPRWELLRGDHDMPQSTVQRIAFIADDGNVDCFLSG